MIRKPVPDGRDPDRKPMHPSDMAKRMYGANPTRTKVTSVASKQQPQKTGAKSAGVKATQAR